ncbi:MAG TPA: hypothetical protein VHM94_00340 [Acidimicrobiia bacterium]|nr:hypothetical protein [Acidimicrobiia bacterium]
MASNPDPKPGRWILPLVIVGMIGFTYLFVNSLEGSAVNGQGNGADTTVAGGRTTTTERGGNQGTSGGDGTTVPNNSTNSEYVDSLRAAQADLDDIAGDLNQANTDWEEDGVSPSDAFNAAADASADWAATVSEITPPDDAVDTHGEVVESADAVAVAAAEVLEGYQAPDDGTLRREAVEAFNDAVAAFDRAVDATEGGQGA